MRPLQPGSLFGPVGKGLDRLLRVLHQIGDRLRDQPPVAADDDRLLADFGFECHVGARHLAIEHGAAHQFADVVVLHFRLRRAREGGKLVDHARDVADLTDDGVGAAIEHLPILGDVLPYLRRMRSAASWIGVSGFLISWAMRRATSAQAAVRCAATSSVTSSKVMTEPSPPPACCSRGTRTEKRALLAVDGAA